MKSSKPRVMLGVVVVAACAFAGVVALKRHSAQTPAQLPGQVAAAAANHGSQGAAAPAASAIASGPAVPEAPVAPPDAAAAPTAKAEVPSLAKPPTQTNPVPPPASGKGAIQDPGAREALSLVGVDPKAEAYWIAAINDAKLSAHERQDLIEDLNEDGLSDPKHPNPEDLPVIINRLTLIEELAPNAMDEVNFDAFGEVYKDLLNLAEVAMGAANR